jgi:uncharacterized membrane protein YphA (DoxX/SURF4 family)
MNRTLSLGLLLARVPLGAYMFLAGWNKTFQTGVGEFVSRSSVLTPGFVPSGVGRAYLYLLPFAELIVGAMLILGLFTRAAGWLTALMLLRIIIATSFTGGSGPFHHAAVMLGTALLIGLAGGGAVSIDSSLLSKRGVAKN